jgi:hypothetical protein
MPNLPAGRQVPNPDSRRYFPTVNFVSGDLISKAGMFSFSLTVKSPLRLSGTRHECGQGPLQENSRAAE